MSESTSERLPDGRPQTDEYRERILAAARPVDLTDEDKIELTQDEANFFFETLRNA